MLTVLTVLAHLQIIRQVDGVADDIVRPRGEVHVSDRALGNHQTREHLGQVVGCNTVTVSRVDDCALLWSVAGKVVVGIMRTYERSNNTTDNERNNIRPS